MATDFISETYTYCLLIDIRIPDNEIAWDHRNRDRGEPHGSTPPTPPCVRVRTRRFGWLSVHYTTPGSRIHAPPPMVRPFLGSHRGFTPTLFREGQLSWYFSAAFHSREAHSYSPLQPFGPSISSRSSTMPSADSCILIRVPFGPLSPIFETECRSPGVSPTAFTAHLLDLQP